MVSTILTVIVAVPSIAVPVIAPVEESIDKPMASKLAVSAPLSV
jgi:hypothetical protein